MRCSVSEFRPSRASPSRIARPRWRHGVCSCRRRERSGRRLLRTRHRLQRAGSRDKHRRGATSRIDADAARAGREGISDAQHAGLHQRVAGSRTSHPRRRRNRSRCGARARPRRGAADSSDLPRLADSRLDADDTDERRRDSDCKGTRRRASRARTRTLDRADREDLIADRSAAGGVRAWSTLRRVLRPVPDERIARRPQRESRAVCSSLPIALRAGL